jgi:hypothetical protein
MNVSIQPLIVPISSIIRLSNKDANILDYCQRLSGQAWAGYIDGRFICCWGLVPPSVFSNTAYLWMHFSSAETTWVDLFVFIRRSQIEIQRMLRRYETITGDCEITNDKALRWLRWLGAEFFAPHRGLRPFVIRRRVDG